MLLKSITLCCLVLNVKTQNSYSPHDSQFLNPGFVYNPDNLPVLPLTVPSAKELNKNESPYKKKPTTTVEVQKSYVSEFGSTVEQVPNDDKRNNLVYRQISTPTTPTGDTTQLLRQVFPQISSNRPTALQKAQYGQIKPEISRGQPAAVPQSGPNWLTQQISQGGQTDRPTGSQIQSNPSSFYFPTEQATGYNSLLYSVTNFGVNLLKTIDSLHSGNVVISPFSITSLLGLLQQGASGQTQAQITNALNMSADVSAPAYSRVSEDVRARNSRNILKVANNLFLSDNFAINKNFKNVAINSFNSEVTPLSFQRTEEAARQINSWVALRTKNQIQNLISPDAIDYTTQMVLVNAIYFKGLWEAPFRVESTLSKEFYLSNGVTKTAKFMRMRKMFKTGVDKFTSARVIVLPFERDEYHLMVVLPNDLMGMRRTLASLTDDRLLSYLIFEDSDTELELPRFTIRADTDLEVVLKSMGITNMFRRDDSELNGVGAYGADSPTISSAVHSATLSIDEEGATAAAATAFAAVALSYDEADVEFIVNRPFIAVLWDNKSSLPLFMAKIEDPQQ